MMKKTSRQAAHLPTQKPVNFSNMPNNKFKTAKTLNTSNKENINTSQCKPANHIFKPMTGKKKNSALGLNKNTVSLIINESITAPQSLLDSLLYGDAEQENYNTIAGSLHVTEEQEEELLLQGCSNDDSFKRFRTEPEMTQSIQPFMSPANQRFLPISLQKSCNSLVKVSKVSQNWYKFSVGKGGNSLKDKQDHVLVRRLNSNFKENPQNFIEFFQRLSSCGQVRKISSTLRQFLMENNIVFKKGELETLTKILYNEQNSIMEFQELGRHLEEIFFKKIDEKNDKQISKAIQIYDQLIDSWPEWHKKDISIWSFLKFIGEIDSQNSVQYEKKSQLSFIHQSKCMSSRILECSVRRSGWEEVRGQISNWLKEVFWPDNEQQSQNFTARVP